MSCHCIYTHRATSVPVEGYAPIVASNEIRQNAPVLPAVVLLILDENMGTGSRLSVGPKRLNSQKPAFEIRNDEIDLIKLLPVVEGKNIG
jgi:hypothetical protein